MHTKKCGGAYWRIIIPDCVVSQVKSSPTASSMTSLDHMVTGEHVYWLLHKLCTCHKSTSKWLTIFNKRSNLLSHSVMLYSLSHWHQYPGGYLWPESHLHQPHTRATQKLGMLGKSLTSCQPTPFQPSTKYKSRVWWYTLQSPWWVLHKLSRSTTPSRTIQLPYLAINAPHLSFTSPQAHWVCYLHHLQDCTVATCTLAVPPKTMTTTTRKGKGSRSMGTPLPTGSLQSRTSFWLVNYIAILHCCWVSSVGL